MNRKSYNFFFSLLSFFFFLFCHSERVLYITTDGTVSIEEIDCELKSCLFLDYDKNNLMICFIDNYNCTILHKIASKNSGEKTFVDFIKIAENFTKAQIVAFVTLSNSYKNTILHHAANVGNIDFILAFISWWCNNLDVDFEKTLSFFNSKNVNDKNFLDLLKEKRLEKNVVDKINENIKCTALQFLSLSRFLSVYQQDDES